MNIINLILKELYEAKVQEELNMIKIMTYRMQI